MLTLMNIKVVSVFYCALLTASVSTGEEGIVKNTLANNCYASLSESKPDVAQCESALKSTNDSQEKALLLSNLALIQANAGQFQSAQASMVEALKQDPRNFSVLVNLGNLRIQQRLYREALQSYDAAVAVGAIREPAIYLNRSIALRGLGRYAEARENFIQYKLLVDQSGP